MPADTKISAQRLKRLNALHEQGASAREIAETLDVSKTTAIRWMRERGLEPQGKPGAHRATKVMKDKAASGAAEAAQKAARVGVAAEAALDDVRRAERSLEAHGSALELARRELAKITVQLEKMWASVVAGDASTAVYERLMRWQREYMSEVDRLSPKQDIDPDTDPTSVMLAERTHKRFAKLVTATYDGLRCIHCSEHPFQ
jgi:transposase